MKNKKQYDLGELIKVKQEVHEYNLEIFGDSSLTLEQGIRLNKIADRSIYNWFIAFSSSIFATLTWVHNKTPCSQRFKKGALFYSACSTAFGVGWIGNNHRRNLRVYDDLIIEARELDEVLNTIPFTLPEVLNENQR